MNKEKVLKLINEHEDSYPQILKSKDKEFYNYVIEKFDGKKFSEKLYRYLNNNKRGQCAKCLKDTKFKSIKVGYAKYCSTKCANIVSTKLLSEKSKNNPKNPKFWVVKKCKVCDKEFWSLKKRNQLFCCGKCSSNFTANDNQRLNKIRKTKLKLYGSETYVNPEKYKQTCLKKYGVSNFSFTNEFNKVVSKKAKDKFYDALLINKIYSEVLPLFSKEDYLGTDRHNIYNFKCKKCGQLFTDHLDNSHIPRCLICNPYISGFSLKEKEIVEYIKLLMPSEKIIEKTREIISPLEIDIYIPSKKLAIEYDGLYWHSENSGGKDKNYHLNKTEECLKKGIHLIHIFEDEWIYKQEIVKSRLKHILGLQSDKIYARNCVIKEIEYIECNNFLEKTHLQGKDNSSIRIGAYHKNEIIAIMTFGPLRIALGNKTREKNTYEMYRFAVNKNVAGIAGKLLSYFVKNYKPKEIITYADRRWSVGNLYEKIGFKLISNTSPNYYYIKPGNDLRHHRFNFAKHTLKDKLEIFDPNLTEWQNMQLNGYDRIWDCGHLKYQWNSQL